MFSSRFWLLFKARNNTALRWYKSDTLYTLLDLSFCKNGQRIWDNDDQDTIIDIQKEEFEA